MRFTVTCLPTADRRLADIWTKAADRQAVTSASDHIDVLLANDPLDHVKPLGQHYFLYVPPLLAVCDVCADDRMVEIIEFQYLPLPENHE